MLGDLSFLTLISMWYDVLKHVNVINQAMQSKTIDFESLKLLLKLCIKYLTDYRINGFVKAKNEGIELTKLLNAEPVFVDYRNPRRKKTFKDKFNPEEYFRNTVFNAVLDKVLCSLNERLQQTDDFLENLGFFIRFEKVFKNGRS